MTQHFLPGEPKITVNLRQSARARRISLRVSRLDGKVTLTLPQRVSDQEGLAFLAEKADWVRKQLEDRPEQIEVDVGTSIPFQGALLDIEPGTGKGIRISGDVLLVPQAKAKTSRRIEAFLKLQARERLVAAVDGYARELGRGYNKLTLRDTRSRWGSCTSAGGLMFSWRLIMAPEEVLNYVAAHEVAHLEQMNHSPNFWALVERLYGPHQQERAWLKAHGEKLHRYQF
ncbi:MAG: M48 family metallopeptidase [Cognatishimia sp.]|uniref:M48 family metallopeptidase n=1 Tax=Cognatishimia sp. TaxID=2211648 RepID=UPI003B8BF5F7